MKKQIISLSLGAAAVLTILSPVAASAHEHDTFKIGNKTYQITIGSLNEPLIVDDKSGLDLTVSQGSGMPTMSPDGDMDGPAAASIPVSGLEKTLQVEMIAGAVKKTMDLTPSFGKSGGYETTFFPTVQTSFSYRLFGTINNTPVDLTFNCNPAGNPLTEENDTATKISDGVIQLSKAGAFGCVEAKTDYGFPEPALSGADTKAELAALKTANSHAKAFGITGIALGVLGFISGIGAMKKRKQ